MDQLRSAGATITHDWTAHGRITNVEELRAIGEAEKRGVDTADVLFFLHPGRMGAHVELGLALAQNIPIVMVGGYDIEQKPFYYLEGVTRFHDVTEALTHTAGLMHGDDS